MSALQEFKCPSCGGALEFDSGLQKMKCPFCDSVFDVSELEQKESKEKPEDHEVNDEGMHVYVCQSCGGEVVGDATLSATSCPYCDNPIVMTGSFKDELMPDLIIPFKLDKKAAKEALMKHFEGKKLLPKVFKDENHIDEVKGVYVPFWLVDGQSGGSMVFEATKERRWSDADYNYCETSYYEVIREGSLGFNNIPVKGSSKIDQTLMESIEPFDISEAVDFKTAYLAGYMADKYDIAAEDCLPRAAERMNASTTQEIQGTVRGFHSVSLRGSDVDVLESKTKYALYPVWLLNTTWNGSRYTFAMNGQTGKFVGDLPMDKGAFWRWFGIIGGAVAVLSYALGAALFLF